MPFLDYSDATQTVHDAMVAAFPAHIDRRVSALGVDPADVADAVAMAAAWLEGRYREQRLLEPREQNRSPLELFQAACAFPSERLGALGTEPVERDTIASSALPGDIYGLAPVSSQDLGDEVWKLHVAWGIAKASMVAGATPGGTDPGRSTVGVAVVTSNLMDRTRIVDAAAAGGLSTVVWRNPGAVGDGLTEIKPAVVFVDLDHAASDEIITMLARSDLRIIAYGPHVDDIGMARAGVLGATETVPRSRLFRRLESWFPKPL